MIYLVVTNIVCTFAIYYELSEIKITFSNG